MESRLSVENDEVIVSKVTFHFVAKLEMEVARFGVVAKVDSLPVIPDDVLCTRVLVVAAGNQLLHPRASTHTDTQTRTRTHTTKISE